MKNKNFCKVKIKSDRKCLHCNINIPKGTICLTINTKYKGRRWLCNDCEDSLNRLGRLEANIENVPFDDEGAYQANLDAYIEELNYFNSR